MGAFFYGVFLQWKLDIRSKTLLLTCYIVPLLFFAMMGGIFTAVMPEARYTLIQSMTVFGVTMGALIGLPPSLTEIYGSDVKNVYRANGVPVSLGLVLTNVSAFVHLFTMSVILYMAAPLAFQAQRPEHPGAYFLCLAVFIAVSLSLASMIGLAVRDPAKTPMVSILVFLPSVILSGILFPMDLLPKALETAGKILPAAWGYRLLADGGMQFAQFLPLAAIWILTVCICAGLLHRAEP